MTDHSKFLANLLQYHGGTSTLRLTTNGKVTPALVKALLEKELVTVKKLEPLKGRPYHQIRITPAGRKLLAPKETA